MKKSQLSVIIPVFNEEKTIGVILKKVLKREEVLEIIVVDDGSTDRSSSIIKKFLGSNVFLFKHQGNKGKGAAIIKGLKRANGKYVIIQDADLEYDPDDYPNLLAPLVKNEADFVIGTRWQSKHGYWYTLLGNWMITELTNFLFKTESRDAYSGYKVGKKSVWERLKLTSNGFEIEAEIMAKLALLKANVEEVPINYRPRLYYQGKKIKLSDAIKGVAKLLQIWVSNLVKVI